MLYFSELNNKKVVATNQAVVGYLDDLIFTVVGPPYIEKLVVCSSAPWSFKTQRMVIPIEYFRKLNHTSIVIDEQFKQVGIGENELYIKKNLLDTQVIDVEENNVVRVNDVLIQTVNSHGFVIYGVDIGIAGILRWFGIEKIILRLLRRFGKSIPQYTVAWSDTQPLELTRGRVVLNLRYDKVKNIHPADLADYLETQNFKNVMAFIKGMDKKYLAQLVSELNPNFQISLFKSMPTDKVASIIAIMDPDDAVDAISEFPRKKREEIVKNLPDKEASQIRRLLSLSSTPLGEFLNSKFLTVYPEQTVEDAIQKVKKEASDFSFLDYIYIVNKEGHLVGVLNLHELLLQDKSTQIFRFMIQRVVVANLHTSPEVAFLRMVKYRFYSLPIVDDEKRLIGIVSIDDLGEAIIKRFKR